MGMGRILSQTGPLAAPRQARYMIYMPIDGSRFVAERQKLCTWLESEKQKILSLPTGMRTAREQELEREFRSRLDRLYGEVSGGRVDLSAAKLN
jgi:hypothetical protein